MVLFQVGFEIVTLYILLGWNHVWYVHVWYIHLIPHFMAHYYEGNYSTQWQCDIRHVDTDVNTATGPLVRGHLRLPSLAFYWSKLAIKVQAPILVTIETTEIFQILIGSLFFSTFLFWATWIWSGLSLSCWPQVQPHQLSKHMDAENNRTWFYHWNKHKSGLM